MHCRYDYDQIYKEIKAQKQEVLDLYKKEIDAEKKLQVLINWIKEQDNSVKRVCAFREISRNFQLSENDLYKVKIATIELILVHEVNLEPGYDKSMLYDNKIDIHIVEPFLRETKRAPTCLGNQVGVILMFLNQCKNAEARYVLQMDTTIYTKLIEERNRLESMSSNFFKDSAWIPGKGYYFHGTIDRTIEKDMAQRAKHTPHTERVGRFRRPEEGELRAHCDKFCFELLKDAMLSSQRYLLPLRNRIYNLKINQQNYVEAAELQKKYDDILQNIEKARKYQPHQIDKAIEDLETVRAKLKKENILVLNRNTERLYQAVVNLKKMISHMGEDDTISYQQKLLNFKTQFEAMKIGFAGYFKPSFLSCFFSSNFKSKFLDDVGELLAFDTISCSTGLRV